MDYDYPAKRHWRRWAWNRISERVTRRADGFVLYLAGDGDYERLCAVTKGFPVWNMLAIEREPTTVSLLRKMGRPVIHGELTRVLASWPVDRPVAVVSADLCSGLEASILVCFADVVRNNPSFNDTVFMVNMLRGRDPSNYAVQTAETLRLKGIVQNRHRGFHLYQGVVALMSGSDGRDAEDEGAERGRMALIHQLARPAFASYASRAGTHKFDSVVWANPLGQLARRYPLMGGLLSEIQGRPSHDVDTAQVRRTAAVLAHHTRNGGTSRQALPARKVHALVVVR